MKWNLKNGRVKQSKDVKHEAKLERVIVNVPDIMKKMLRS